MDILLGKIAGSELLFVYGLIALVVVLIIVIIVIDRKESNKKPKNLFDTLNMKIIANPDDYNQSNEVEEKSELIEINQQNKSTTFEETQPIPEIKTINLSEEEKPELIEINQQIKPITFEEIQPIPEVKTINLSEEKKPTLTETIDKLDDIYIESDLEKTQAQIRVEEITEALKKAQVEEQIQEDKYAKFEEEQEKSAIISYNELKESFDRLYSENEKIQYLEDDEIPINIDQLYELNNHKEEKQIEKEIEELPKVKLEDLSDFTKPQSPTSSTTFKSSPLISPVYGIQKPPVEVKTTVDDDIQNANQFLQTLKELKNNLD